MNSITPMTPIDSILKNAICTKKIGFITILIEEIDPDVSYEIYTATERNGKHFVDSASSMKEAQRIGENEIQDIITRMNKRRKGKPTASQLMTLFSLHVSIPVTLTFGEASDLIDTALNEKRQKKRQKYS